MFNDNIITVFNCFKGKMLPGWLSLCAVQQYIAIAKGLEEMRLNYKHLLNLSLSLKVNFHD